MGGWMFCPTSVGFVVAHGVGSLIKLLINLFVG